ncbi:MAG: membrane dipeptidase, partial [Hyphomicrobiaceae bacterium]
MSSDLHKSAIVIDGLVVSRWSRSVFEHMQRGGLTAANCTCSVWENFDGTMRNIGRFKRWLAEHADILRPVKSAADIRAAKAEGKVGIILGFQNTSGLDDLLDSLSLYKELG